MAIKDTSDRKMFIRYRCVYLYYDGREKSDIAKIFGIDQHSVTQIYLHLAENEQLIRSPRKSHLDKMNDS